LLFRVLPSALLNRDAREQCAGLMGQNPEELTPRCMTYNLGRLSLHGLIQRDAHSHRYRLTEFGMRTALFLTGAYADI